MIMEKINVAELLRNCPKGMELDCTMFNNVVFDHISTEANTHPIFIKVKNSDFTIQLTMYGQYMDIEDAKCVIFPKGKTTWEGFHRPFEDGDILAYTSLYTTVFIYRNKDDEPKHTTSFYVGYTIGGRCYCNFHIYDKSLLIALNGDCDTRLATEEEKAKLFKAIKEHGYRWNSEIKTLEKLIEPKFKVGDRIRHKCPEFRGERIVTICCDTGYFTTISDWIDIEHQDDWELIPNNSEKLIEFKNGDIIVCENHWGPFISIFKENVEERNGFIEHCVLDVDDNEFKVKDSASYFNKVRLATKGEKELLFQAIERNGYKWDEETKTLEKLIPNKFDITTLKPFESKVLVWEDKCKKWIPAFWGSKCDRGGYITTYGWCKYCIPLDGNEHLTGTSKDCDKFYKTWRD